jgi:hypothetical protein
LKFNNPLLLPHPFLFILPAKRAAVKRFITCLFILFNSHVAFAQTGPINSDTCHLRISLLTCTPGMELYSTFGHSALRVMDSADGSDLIFNYGTFDFSDPDFYKKFVLGKLLYFLSVDEYADFAEQYRYEGRGITEQVLNLTCREKQTLVAALYENAREENKYYQYDFVYDNCTTRLRDMLENFAEDSLLVKNILPSENVTFRNLIHEYLNKGGQYWSKLGIDILLGMPLDKKASNREAQFLPDYLLKAFDSATINNRPLVEEKKVILEGQLTFKKNFLFSPLVIFSLLFLIVAVISGLKKGKRFFKYFDFVLFFLSGGLGMLILFMWFGTDHQACRNNMNLVWALPTHLVAVFFLFINKSWVKKYFRFTFWLNILLLLVWFFLPQQMNSALLPLLGLIILRSFFLSKCIATESQKH